MIQKLGGIAWGAVGTYFVLGAFSYNMVAWILGNVLCVLGLFLYVTADTSAKETK